MAEFTVPRNPAQAQLPGSLGRPLSTPEDYGSDIGKVLYRIAEDLKEKEITNKVTAFGTKLNESLRESELEIRQRLGREAKGSFDRERERWATGGELYNEFIGDEKDQAVLQRYNTVWANKVDSHYNVVSNHEASQLNVWTVQERSNATQSAINRMGDAPASLIGQELIDEQIADIMMNNPDDVRTQQLAIDAGLESWARAVVMENPEKGVDYVLANKEWIKERAGNAYDNILAAARAEENRMKSEAKRQLALNKQDEMNAINSMFIAGDNPYDIIDRAKTATYLEDKEKNQVIKAAKAKADKQVKEALGQVKKDTKALGRMRMDAILDDNPDYYKSEAEVYADAYKYELPDETAGSMVNRWQKRKGGRYDQEDKARALIKAWPRKSNKKNIIKESEELDEFDRRVMENRGNADFNPMDAAKEIVGYEEPGPGFWASLMERVFGTPEEVDNAAAELEGIDPALRQEAIDYLNRVGLPIDDRNIQFYLDNK